MLTPRKEDTIHKSWLLRLLSAIADNLELNTRLAFKGGTYAALQGYLNRFSIDLDFDMIGAVNNMDSIRSNLEDIFRDLGLKIKDKSTKIPQYFLKYPAAKGSRNSIKIDALFPPPKTNTYEKVLLPEIDRMMNCQTKETMFANKLVAVMDRFQKTGAIAGRDIYDIREFFLQGFSYNTYVIEERTGQSTPQFFESLSQFIKKKVTETIINQDLNYLLPPEEFQKIRKNLKNEIILSLQNEIKRINS